MDIHLDSRGERLIERQLRSGRYHSPEQVVVSALEALTQNEQAITQNDERRRAVQDMLAFAGEHGFTLGEDLSIRDLVHEGHKY
jgi:Arc/MetJ-type ribon-helix-helix transcriptional regulator